MIIIYDLTIKNPFHWVQFYIKCDSCCINLCFQLTLFRLTLRSLRSSPLSLVFLFSFSGDRSSISLLACLLKKRCYKNGQQIKCRRYYKYLQKHSKYLHVTYTIFIVIYSITESKETMKKRQKKFYHGNSCSISFITWNHFFSFFCKFCFLQELICFYIVYRYLEKLISFHFYVLCCELLSSVLFWLMINTVSCE